MLHSYSIDFPRSRIHISIAFFAVAVGWSGEWLATHLLGINALGLSPFAIATSLYVGFDRWLWKYPPFSWLHLVPNIAGEWEGEIESSYGSDDDNELAPIKPDGSRLMIGQRWSKIEINYRNPESSHSHSIAARMEVDSEIPKVTYVYENEPEGDGLQTSQQRHRGTVVLYLYEDDERTLRGEYYTDHAGGQSYGEMRFEQTND